MKDASFQPDILSKLELDTLNQECDMHQALAEEQAVLNFLACVTSMSKVESTVKPTIPEHVQHYAANRHGFLTVGDVQLDCDVLLDSGASHANYMSESYYVRNLHRLAEYTVRIKSSVYI